MIRSVISCAISEAGDSLEITLNRPLARETLAKIGGVREISSAADGQTYVLTGQNAELMLHHQRSE